VEAQIAGPLGSEDLPAGPDQQSFDGHEWPLERLEREIGELAAHIHAATCRWLAMVAEFDRREGWADWGCKSCAHWLSWRCALAPSAAREQVRVARRLSELPRIRAAFGRGELSYSQVRALSRVATPELEPSLLDLARYATAAQLERTLRAYRGVLERELSPADRAHGERYLVCEHDDDGSLLLRARWSWGRSTPPETLCAAAAPRVNPRVKVEVFPRRRKRRRRALPQRAPARGRYPKPRR
jgi:Domain of unknown function (DUF222)